MQVKRKLKKRFGFTLVELLVVISLIAVVATMATGVALKSIRQSRVRRVEATRKILELALANYHALHGQWSFALEEPEGRTFQTFKGQDNYRAFEAIFKEAAQGRGGVDTSAIFTRVSQGRMTVRQALERGATAIPVGYADPSNPDKFRYFKVSYNFATDSVKVETE